MNKKFIFVLLALGGQLSVMAVDSTNITVAPCILTYTICILVMWSVCTRLLPEIPLVHLTYVSPSILGAAISFVLRFSKLTFFKKGKVVISRFHLLHLACMWFIVTQLFGHHISKVGLSACQYCILYIMLLLWWPVLF